MAANTGPQAIVDSYLLDLEARVCARHLENVRGSLERALVACPKFGVDEVLRWRTKLVRSGASNRTANLLVGTVRAAVRWAIDCRMIPASRALTLRPLPQREGDLRRRRRALNDVEIEQFLGSARTIDKGLDLGQAPLWETMIETGLRFGEATALRRKDLVEDVLVVRPETAKSRRMRYVPVSPNMRASLEKLDRPLLFPSPSGKPWTRKTHTWAGALFHRAIERAGIARVDADGRRLDIHALRVTACSRMLRRGVPLAIVSRILGHRDGRMTMRIYTDLGVDDLRREVSRGWSA